MQKIKFFLFVVLTAFFTEAVSQQIPTVYPGAVLKNPGIKNHYLTKDNYSEVRAYYVNENNEPRREHDNGESGISAFFSYVRRMPDDIGVTVSERQGRSRVPYAVFQNLRGLAAHGVVDMDRVNEIEKKYSYLDRCYFVRKRDERGEVSSVDDIIFRKYENKLGIGGIETVDAEDIMERAQALMGQGRMDEAMELLQKFQDQQIAGIELATSPEAVDMWIECLDEIASEAYQVEIRIHL